MKLEDGEVVLGIFANLGNELLLPLGEMEDHLSVFQGHRDIACMKALRRKT